MRAVSVRPRTEGRGEPCRSCRGRAFGTGVGEGACATAVHATPSMSTSVAFRGARQVMSSRYEGGASSDYAHPARKSAERVIHAGTPGEHRPAPITRAPAPPGGGGSEELEFPADGDGVYP